MPATTIQMKRRTGNWCGIAGHHNLTAPGGFMINVMGRTARGWNRARAALSFAKLTNDGDDEGAIFLDRIPSKSEAWPGR